MRGKNISSIGKNKRALTQNPTGRTKGTSIRDKTKPVPSRRSTHEIALGIDALDLSPDCIKIIGLDGKLRHMNRAGCVALGIPEASVEGREWATLLPEQIHEDARTALREACAGEDVRFPGLSDGGPGELRYWDNMLTPLRGSSGVVEQILCVSRDITKQRATEGRRSALTIALGRQSRRLLDALRDIQVRKDPRSEASLNRALASLGDPINGLKSAVENAEELVGETDLVQHEAELPIKPASTATFDRIDWPALTSKELECLFWVILGKTAWETASILGRSRRTVEFHLANAVKKLGATNKAHAAMLALQRGVI